MPLGVIARAAGLSTSQFIRRFRAVFGETPHQMRIRTRLDAARRLLVLHGESVTTACMAVGFSSVGSFSHLFTRHFGEPPSTYRRRLLAVPSPSSVLEPDCVGLMNAALAAGARQQFSRSVPAGDIAESATSAATPAACPAQEKPQ
jgi:AraC-like DNA-binding protein